MVSRVWRIMAAVLCLSLISACGSSSNRNSSEQQNLPFLEVVTTAPADGDVQIAVDSAISVLFSEDVNPETVNAETFIVTDADGIQVLGTFTVVESTVTFAPVSALAFDKIYEVTLTIDIADLNGSPLESEYLWSFTTIPPPDPDPLSFGVVSTIPATDAIEVAVDSSISVLFSRAIDAATINAASFIVADLDEIQVPGMFMVSGSTVTFTPSTVLDFDMTYEVVLTVDIADVDGTQLEDEYFWSFTTASPPDTTPPSIVFFSPDNGATGIPTNSIVAVTFSETIDTASVTAGILALYDGNGVQVPGEIFQNDFSVIFVPDADLANESGYYADLASGISDLAGNIAEGFSWSFSTGAAPDRTGPTVVNVSPVAGAFVSVEQTISAVFSEIVNPYTVNSGTFIVRDGSGAQVQGTIVANGATVTFTPAGGLNFKEVYEVTISGIEDMAHNAMESAYMWGFSTGMGVVKVVPRPGGKNIPLNQPVVITFSEPVNPVTIHSETVFLRNEAGAKVNGTLTTDGINVTFMPTANFDIKAVYRATLTTGIFDLSDMPMPDDYNWSFTTGKRLLKNRR